MRRFAEAGNLDIDDIALKARLDWIDANNVANDRHVEVGYQRSSSGIPPNHAKFTNYSSRCESKVLIATILVRILKAQSPAHHGG